MEQYGKRNSTTFVKGPRIKKICPVCKEEFETTPKNRKVYCCIKCLSIHVSEVKRNNNSKTNQCIKLYEEGLKYREIAEKLNIKPSSVASMLNKAKFRGNRNGEKDNKTKNRKLYTECSICGFNRIVEMAHIKPASEGGTYEPSNIIGLCPNHHHLFDMKKLEKDEACMLKDRIENWEDFIFKPKTKRVKRYISTDLKTGEEKIYTTLKEVKAEFTDMTGIYKTIRGIFKQYYGRTWKIIEEEIYV